MIEIDKIDNKKILIKADDKIIKKIDNYFSRYVDNYKFIEKVRQGLWDGKKRFLNYDHSMSITLLYDLKEFLELNKLKYKINFSYEGKLDKNKFKNWLSKNLDLPFEPREYQFKMAYDILKYKNVLAESLTGSGKSLVANIIFRTMIHLNKKCILIVPSINLLYQMLSDFKNDYNWKDADDYIQLMGDTFTDKDFTKTIIITTWQSLRAKRYKKFEESFRQNSLVSQDKLKMVKLQVKEKVKKFKVKNAIKLLRTFKSYFKNFDDMILDIVNYEKKIIEDFKMIDCIICDEVHKVKGASIQNILHLSSNAEYILGMTGTVDSKEKLSVLELKSLYGRHLIYNTYPELIENKIINDFCVNIVTINYPLHFKEEFYRETSENWRDEYYFLSKIQERNKIIEDIINSHENSGIIIYDFIEEGDNFLEYFKDKLIDCKVFWMDGKRKKDIKKLKEIKEMTEKIVIFGTDKTIGTGLNLPNLDFGISVSTTSDSKSIRQKIGRIIRRSKFKSKCSQFYDINDNMCYQKGNRVKINRCIEHSEIRREIYKKYKIKVAEKTLDAYIKEEDKLF